MKIVSRTLPLVLLLALNPVLSAQQPEPTWQELRQKAMSAFDTMGFADCIELMSQAIEKAPRNDATAEVRVEMHRIRGTAFEQTGKPEQAIADLMRAVKLGEGVFEGEARIAIVNDLRSAARIALQSGDAGEGERSSSGRPPDRRPLEGDAGRPAHDRPLRAGPRRAHAADWKSAASTLELYLGALEKARGTDSADLVSPLWDLALCHRAMGQPKQAVPQVERWISIYEKVRGEGSPTTARGLALLCDLHIEARQYDEAESACARWMTALERVTRKHPEAVTVFARRARIARDLDDLDGEQKHLEEAIERARNLPWPEPIKIAGLQRKLASAQRRAEKLDTAMKTIETAIATYGSIRRRIGPPCSSPASNAPASIRRAAS